MANAKLVCALLLCMLLSAPMLNVEASMPCHIVGVNLAPCLCYLHKGGRGPHSCCNGVRKVNNSARTTKDRRDTCNCLKGTAKQFRRFNDRLVAALPGICRVKIPFRIRISTSVDCNRDSILSRLKGGYYRSCSTGQDSTTCGWIVIGIELANHFHTPHVLAMPCGWQRKGKTDNCKSYPCYSVR